jgi:hypothetical protein
MEQQRSIKWPSKADKQAKVELNSGELMPIFGCKKKYFFQQLTKEQSALIDFEENKLLLLFNLL